MGKRSSHALAPAVLGWARRAGKLAADLAGVAAGGSAIVRGSATRRFSDPAWNENPLG